MTNNTQHSLSTAASPNWHSWLSLLVAGLFLLVANGRFAIPIATWLSMLFMLRFVRTQPKRIGLSIATVVLFFTFAFQLKGMVPVPPLFYYIITAVYTAVLLAPFWADRVITPRLSGFSSTLLFPTAWVTMEWLVANFTPYGSWCALAYAQHENLVLLQLVSVTGLYGVSFLIAWFASVGCWVWERGLGANTRRGALIFSAVITVVMLAGGLRLVAFAPDGSTVRVASLTRPDIDLFAGVEGGRGAATLGEISDAGVSKIRENADAILDDLLRRAEQEVQAGAEIVFWGETNGFSLKQDEPAMIERGAAFAIEHDIYLGMASAVFDPESAQPLENKISMISPDGSVSFEYWKAIPVPGGEATIQAPGDGIIHTVDSEHGRVGAAICFDMDFPGHLQQAGRAGTDILLVPSNDWADIDPWHTHMARFRAVEQGVNMIRHTSSGLSVATDYQGRVLASMDHYTTDARNMVAHVPTRGTRTIYSRVGDLFSWICMAGFVLLAVMSWRGRVRALRAMGEPGSTA